MPVLSVLHQIDSEDFALRQEKSFKNTAVDPKVRGSALALKKSLRGGRAQTFHLHASASQGPRQLDRIGICGVGRLEHRLRLRFVASQSELLRCRRLRKQSRFRQDKQQK